MSPALSEILRHGDVLEDAATFQQLEAAVAARLLERELHGPRPSTLSAQRNLEVELHGLLPSAEDVEALALEAERAEDVKLDADFTGMTFQRIDQSIAMGALFTAHHLGAKAIVAMTDSGSTALWMSRHLIRVPIYALTPNVSSQRRMTLYRNVRPLLMSSSKDRDTALNDAEAQLKKLGIVSSGDVYAITCGEPMGAPGGTNMMKVCRVA